ncbi:MAG: ADP-ribosylglycohydrolase family protein [Methylocella sp.]
MNIDRAISALLGLAVGDALGTTWEFAERETVPPLTDMIGGGPFGLKPGEWTDDTAMALCLADSLLTCAGLDQPNLMQRFCRWWRDGENSCTGDCLDIGITTSEALCHFERTGDPIAGRIEPQKAGNGSLMRLVPVAIYWHGNRASAEAAARAQSVTTHGVTPTSPGPAAAKNILPSFTRKSLAFESGAQQPAGRPACVGCTQSMNSMVSSSAMEFNRFS